MSKNGIAWLPTKEARQLAKLQLAALDRARVGNPRASFNIDDLPTKYVGNSVFNNPNIGGLVQGRPWLAGGIVEGPLWRTQYTQTYYDVGTSIYDNPPVTSGEVEGFILPETVPEYCTFEFRGYFRANWTGTWTFNLSNVDDAAVLWIGPSALDVENIDTGSALANVDFGAGADSGTIDLVEGEVYPIRLLFANGPGAASLSVEWWNDLTASRLLSLDAAIDNTSTAFNNTDEFGFPGYGLLVTPSVARSTDFGGVMVFDGTELTQAGYGYIRLTQNFDSDFSSGITISIWANIATGSGIWSRLIDFGNGAGNDNILIAVWGNDPTKMCMQMWDGSNPGTNVQVLGSIPFDEWKLYTLTGDGSNYYWYVNDQLVNTLNGISFLPNTVTRLANKCRIGGSNFENPNDWNLKGSIASLEMYNRALSTAEITGLYKERKGRFGL